MLVEDGGGALWRSDDGGFSLASLTGPGARVEAEGDVIRVIAGARGRV